MRSKGAKGKLEEVNGNESSEKEGRVSGNDWRGAARAGRHNEIPRVMISDDGNMQCEVEARNGCASRVVGGMNEAILRRKELCKQAKLQVVNEMVLLVLAYGCEAWAACTEQRSKIQAVQMIRRLRHAKWQNNLASLPGDGTRKDPVGRRRRC